MSRFSKCTFPAVSPPEILAQLSSRALYIYICVCVYVCGPGSSVSIATDYGLDFPGSNPGGDEIFRSLQYNGYRVIPGGKVRPERVADHSPPSSAAVMEE